MFWHVFFDTTELRARRFPTEEIFKAAFLAKATLYVPELAIEERALQLEEDFKGVHAGAKRFERQLGVPIPPLKPRDELLESLQADLRVNLTERVTISPFGYIDADTQRALFDRRLHAEFKDTAIVLSIIGHAATLSLPVCAFVTEDGGVHAAEALWDFARTRGVMLVAMKPNDVLPALKQMPEIVAKVKAFVEGHIDVLNAYLNREEFKRRVLQNMITSPPLGSSLSALETFRGLSPDLGSMSIQVVSIGLAIPRSRLVDGKEAPLFLRLSFEVYAPDIVNRIYEAQGDASATFRGSNSIEPFVGPFRVGALVPSERAVG